MQPSNVYFALPLIISALLFLLVAVYSLYRRSSYIAAALVALLAGDALWLGAHVVLMLSQDAAIRVFGAHVQATGILMAQVSWLILVLLYTGDIRGVMRRWWAQVAICAPPLALLVTLWLAPDEFFFGDWRHLELGSRLIQSLGPGFWLQAAWGEATSAVGTLLLVLAYRRAARPRKTRDRLLIAAALLPWIASIGLLLNIRPFNLNLTPFGVALSGVVLAWGVLRHRWFGIVPVAQRVILESLADGVVVVEREGRIVDLNPAALAILACKREEALDQPAARILARRSETLSAALQQAAGTNEPALIAVDVVGAQRWYEALVKPLYGWRGKQWGQLLTLHDVTERSAVEQALRQSEARYRLLAENVSDVIWTTDVAGHLTYVSPSVEAFIGISPQEMPSMTLRDLFSESSVDLMRAAAQTARQPGAAETWQHEVEFRHKDGSTVWTEVKGNLLRAADGQLVGVIGVARDIERRKRVEAALQRRLAMEAMVTRLTARLASVTVHDLSTGIIQALRLLAEFVDVQRCYMLWLTDDGMTIEHCFEWLTPASNLRPTTVASIAPFVWALEQHNRLQTVDVPDINQLPPEAQAERDYWEASGAQSALALPLFVGDRLAGVLGFSADRVRPAWAEDDVRLLRLMGEALINVLTRARFEQALQASEAHLKVMNDQLEMRVVQRTAELKTANTDLQQEIHRRAETELALRRSETRNRALLRAIPDLMWVVTSAGIITDCQSGDVRQDPFLGCLTDYEGHEVSDFLPSEIAEQVIAQVRAALDSGSGHVQQLEFQITAGESVQEYEARAVALPDDQALVIVRNVSEHVSLQRQLLRAERLAALGQLAAALAHDLNNPLQVILNYLDLMLDFPLADAEKREYLQIMRQQIQRLSRQVADVLALARPQPQHVPVAPVSEPADVTDVIRRVLALVSKRLRQSGIQVNADLTQTARALIPSDQLMQVCLNLVVNAIEALQGRSSGRLQIMIQPIGDALTLSFCNDGPAMSPDVLPYIMEPFYTTKSDGSGLGLWVCCNILRKYGGALSVRNLANDQGVVFDLSLPVAYDKPEKSQ